VGEVKVTRWQPIETAPYDTEVEVRLTTGRKIKAILRANASLDEDENDCDQWQATGDYPPCWSDGACWETNADGFCSAQPIEWRTA
jgi:hypothetical protein